MIPGLVWFYWKLKQNLTWIYFDPKKSDLKINIKISSSIGGKCHKLNSDMDIEGQLSLVCNLLLVCFLLLYKKVWKLFAQTIHSKSKTCLKYNWLFIYHGGAKKGIGKELNIGKWRS